jgi:PilZ domain-containing protein
VDEEQEYTDRRKFARYTHDLPVTYQTLAAELAVQCPHCGGELVVAGRNLDQLLIHGIARTQTLSLGGMAIELDRSFAPGKQMLLQFPVGSELISVRSVVVICQRSARGLFRMGLEFLDLTEHFRQVLVDYFADCLLKEARDRSLEMDITHLGVDRDEEEATDVRRREIP